MLETEPTYHKQVEQLAAGSFDFAPHALESFRVRIVKKARDKTAPFLKDLIVRAASREWPPLQVYKSVQHGGWRSRIVVDHLDFDIAFQDSREQPNRLTVVTAFDHPGGTSRLDRFDMNQRVSLKEYLDMQDNYERVMLRLEDEVHDLKQRPTITDLNKQLSAAKQAGYAEGAAQMRRRIGAFLDEVGRLLEPEDYEAAELTRQLNETVAEYPLTETETETETIEEM